MKPEMPCNTLLQLLGRLGLESLDLLVVLVAVDLAHGVGEGLRGLPGGGLARGGLGEHLVNLLEGEALGLGDEEVGVDEGAGAQSSPNEEDGRLEVALVGSDHVGSDDSDDSVPACETTFWPDLRLHDTIKHNHTTIYTSTFVSSNWIRMVRDIVKHAKLNEATVTDEQLEELGAQFECRDCSGDAPSNPYSWFGAPQAPVIPTKKTELTWTEAVSFAVTSRSSTQLTSSAGAGQARSLKTPQHLALRWRLLRRILEEEVDPSDHGHARRGGQEGGGEQSRSWSFGPSLASPSR